jgi:glycosyltransferase involved in cell wall biosynthesis
MVCGCPALAARAAFILEVCSDVAFHFAPYDVRAMTNTILALLTDQPLRQRLAPIARLHPEHFKWSKVAKKQLGLVTSLAE